MGKQIISDFVILVQITIVLFSLALTKAQNTTNCEIGTFLDQNKICTPCSKNCFSCVNSSSCLSCEPSFYLSSLQCLSCPLNCKSCNQPSTCDICQTGYLYQSSLKACIWADCTAKYCLSCNSDKNYSVCGSCADEYMLVGTHCVSCTWNCLKCTKNTCQSCKPGSYLRGTRCLNCISNCVTCNDNSSCQTCASGYSYVSQTNQCQPSKTSTSRILIVLIPVQIGAFLLILIITCIYRSRRHKIQGQNIDFNAPESLVRLEIHQYENQKTNQWVDQQCPICLQSGCDSQTSCKHIFHFKCLLSWKKLKKSCPSCRQQSYSIKTICRNCEAKILQLPSSLKQMVNQVRCTQCKYSIAPSV